MVPDTYPAPPDEAVGLAIDGFIAALSDDQLEALLARTRPSEAARTPAKRKRRNIAREGR
jgi:hypothetical protein